MLGRFPGPGRVCGCSSGLSGTFQIRRRAAQPPPPILAACHRKGTRRLYLAFPELNTNSKCSMLSHRHHSSVPHKEKSRSNGLNRDLDAASQGRCQSSHGSHSHEENGHGHGAEIIEALQSSGQLRTVVCDRTTCSPHLQGTAAVELLLSDCSRT
jgi:hypothetical protein